MISKCLRNDQRSYKELYEKTVPYMIFLCRKYNVGDRELEDTLQEIYSEMFVSLHRYDGEKGEFMTWFRRLGLHIIMKTYRNRNTQQVNVEHFEETLKAEDAIIEVSVSRDISTLVEKLPKGYKTIINLAKDGLDHEEIAKYLGITQSTSRSQLSRAKQLLRNQLKSLKYYVL